MDGLETVVRLKFLARICEPWVSRLGFLVCCLLFKGWFV